MGLHRAGFDVVGVDIRPQPRYPFEFHQGDALEYPLDGFDFVWASPPCQRYSEATRTAPGPARNHPDLIAPVRDRLRSAHFSVIENVPRSPLRNPVVLCGSMFGLWVRRHRLFEIRGFDCNAPACRHDLQIERRFPANRSGRFRRARVVTVAGHGGVSTPGHGGKASVEIWKQAMGIDWMTRDELAQAIPPAYGEHIGRAAMMALQAVA